jgi:hypothetical protein
MSGDADHHGEEGRLNDVESIERRSAVDAAEDIEKRPVDIRSEGSVARFDLLAEGSRGVEETPGHSVPLRALPRKDEDDLAVCGSTSNDGGRRGLSAREAAQRLDAFVRVANEKGGAMLKVGT